MSNFKILCPIDFSEASYQALDVAAGICKSTIFASPSPGSELHLLHVLSPIQPSISIPPSPGFGPPQSFMPMPQFSDYSSAEIVKIEQAAQREAEGKLQEIIQTRVPQSVSTHTVARCGDSGLEVLRAAEAGHYDLIVMGTHGVTGWRHLILGSVTEEVVRLAPCPVITVRPSEDDTVKQYGPIKKILCTTDFSEPSFQGLETAADLAARGEATLLVLHVMEPLAPPLGTIPQSEFDESRSNDASHMLLDVIKEHVTKDNRGYIGCHRLVRIGKSSEEIVHAAGEENADLIVIATQGETGWRHMAFGSVTEDVVRSAPCPVLTVRRVQKDSVEKGSVEKDSVERERATEAFPSEPTKAPSLAALELKDLNAKNFPQDGSASDKLHFLLNYAVLAPSSHNSQPWLWKLNGDSVELYADRARSLPVIDPTGRELTISCGAALFYLRLAIRHFGYTDEVKVLPDPKNKDLLATIRLGGAHNETNETRLLFSAIARRHTDRTLFDDRRLTTSMRLRLKDAAQAEGAHLHFIDSGNRDSIIRLIEKGEIELGHDKWYRHELAEWMRSNHDERADGIPGHALGLNTFASHLAPGIVRSFDIGALLAAKERMLAENAPVLAILETESDTPSDWLLAGQALARVLLRACANGVYASFLNAPLEADGLSPQLRQTLELQGFPQLLFRLGYASDETSLKPTPRRALHKVLVNTDPV